MTQLCRKVVQVDVRWSVLEKVSFIRRFFRFIWDRILICSVGKPASYRRLPSQDPSSMQPETDDAGFGQELPAAATSGGYETDSDLVSLKISILGDCHIGKTSFVVSYLLTFPNFLANFLIFSFKISIFFF